MDDGRIIVEQPNPPTGEMGATMGRKPPFRRPLSLLIAAVVLLVFVLGIVTGYLEKWLWMRQLDYTGIFWTLLSVQWAMFCSAFAFTFLFLWINLRQAAGNSAALRADDHVRGPALLSGADAVAPPSLDFSPWLLKLAVVLVSAGVALFFAIGFYAQLGYLPALSLRRILRSVRSALRRRCRVLCLSSAVLRDVANQSDVTDGVGARGRPSDLRVLWTAACKPQRRQNHGSGGMPRRISPCFCLFWLPTGDLGSTSITMTSSTPLLASYMVPATRLIT